MQYILFEKPVELNEFEQKVVKELLYPLKKKETDEIKVTKERISIFCEPKIFLINLKKTKGINGYSFKEPSCSHIENALLYLRKIKKIAYSTGGNKNEVQKAIDKISKTEKQLTLDSTIFLKDFTISLEGEESSKILVKNLLKNYPLTIKVMKNKNELTEQLEILKDSIFQ